MINYAKLRAGVLSTKPKNIRKSQVSKLLEADIEKGIVVILSLHSTKSIYSFDNYLEAAKNYYDYLNNKRTMKDLL